MDLVARLRRMSDMTTTGNDLNDIGRAADEIERLRKIETAARVLKFWELLT